MKSAINFDLFGRKNVFAESNSKCKINASSGQEKPKGLLEGSPGIRGGGGGGGVGGR